MAKLILHIGTHKTGSTSIQRYARKNTHRLGDQGVYYPNYDVIGRSGHYAHHDVAHLIAGQHSSKLEGDDLASFVDHLAQTTADYHTILLSAEPMYRHTIPTMDSFDDPALYWKAREAYVEKLSETFNAFDVEVIVVLRRQDTFALSLYQETVKASRFTDDFVTFLGKREFYFDYLQQLKIVSRHFENLRVLIFENLTSGTGSFEQEFFAAIGIPTESFESSEPQNSSLPPNFVEYKRRLNQTRLPAQKLRRIGTELELLASQDEWRASFKYCIAPDLVLDLFLQSHLQGNRAVAATYCNNSSTDSSRTLFPATPRPSKEEYPGLSEVEFREITADLFGRLLNPSPTRAR